MSTTKLGEGPDGWIEWEGLRWKPLPDSHLWFKWERKAGGLFTQVHEDDVPAEVYAVVARRVMLGGD